MILKFQQVETNKIKTNKKEQIEQSHEVEG